MSKYWSLLELSSIVNDCERAGDEFGGEVDTTLTSAAERMEYDIEGGASPYDAAYSLLEDLNFVSTSTSEESEVLASCVMRLRNTIESKLKNLEKVAVSLNVEEEVEIQEAIRIALTFVGVSATTEAKENVDAVEAILRTLTSLEPIADFSTEKTKLALEFAKKELS